MAFVAERTVEAVTVASGENGDFGWTICDEFGVVTYAVAGGYVANVDDASA